MIDRISPDHFLQELKLEAGIGELSVRDTKRQILLLALSSIEEQRHDISDEY